MSKVKKVLVYGETERQARKFYRGSEGEAVGYRLISEDGNGEEADEKLYACEKPKTKKKGNKTNGK